MFDVAQMQRQRRALVIVAVASAMLIFAGCFGTAETPAAERMLELVKPYDPLP